MRATVSVPAQAFHAELGRALIEAQALCDAATDYPTMIHADRLMRSLVRAHLVIVCASGGESDDA